jgi:predicted glycoside hydrolase/deacetylase ChbG (UPF0249 family)
VTHPHVIITADDFGIDARVNEAVVRAFTDGLITHASLLVNLPGFDEACSLSKQLGFGSRIGVHLNLTEGVPLTAGMRRTSFCIDGHFAPSHRFRRYTPLTSADRSAVEDEVRAQIAAARAGGFDVAHLDSHNDVHLEPTIAGIVLAIAKECSIPRVRPARTCGARQGTIRWLQFRCYNAWLKRRGLRHVRHFGTIDDVLWLTEREGFGPEASAEIMTHPRLGADGTVLDAPSMKPLSQALLHLRARLAPAQMSK